MGCHFLLCGHATHREKINKLLQIVIGAKKAITDLAQRAISEIIVLQKENRKAPFEEVAIEL